MTVATENAASKPPERAELVLKYFDTELIVTPPDNPIPAPAKLAEMVASMREHDQLVPGWVFPSPDLPLDQRLCMEGNTRLAAARLLGRQFWAFDYGRPLPEAERIRLTFNYNFIRRRMGREEIAERAARYIEITGATQADAARHLHVSGPTLSRAFGDQRIPPALRPRAELLGHSIRSLVAAMPVPLMDRAIAFAEKPGPDGRKPTRDQVAAYLRQLRKDGKGKGHKPKAVTLRCGARTVTLAVSDRDSAATVAEDLKSIALKLGKYADVPPDGWPFLFQ